MLDEKRQPRHQAHYHAAERRTSPWAICGSCFEGVIKAVASHDGLEPSDRKSERRHNSVALDQLPRQATVVRVEFGDLRGAATRWLLLRTSEVSLCRSNPGFPESLTLHADRRTLIGWWRGDFSDQQARRRGLRLTGPASPVRAFPGWFQRYLLAEVPPVPLHGSRGRGGQIAPAGVTIRG